MHSALQQPINHYWSHFHFESNSCLLWFRITALSDWLQKLTPLSQPIRSKTKTIVATCMFSRASCRLHVFASSLNWFTGPGLSVSFVIGQSVGCLNLVINVVVCPAGGELVHSSLK